MVQTASSRKNAIAQMETSCATNANERKLKLHEHAKCETRNSTGSNDKRQLGKKETACETTLRTRSGHANTHTCARDEQRREMKEKGE